MLRLARMLAAECSSVLYNRCVIGLALATGAALVSAGYQSMAPTGQWFGKAFHGLPRGSKQIALTFDDGPNDPYTLKLLDVLAKHDVSAAFFLIGQFLQRRTGLAAWAEK